jgi:hypothetical protein
MRTNLYNRSDLARHCYCCSPGNVLALLAVALGALLGVIGLGLYLGVLAYTQGELQKLVKDTALVGAAALYDDVTANYTPMRNPAVVNTATTATWNTLISGVPWLANAPASDVACTTSATDVVTCSSQAQVPTPFLSLLGISSMTVQANVSAQAAKTVVNGFTINTTPGSPMMQIVDLPVPLTNGPGVDFAIRMPANPQHGYRVQACSGGQCYDVTSIGVPVSGGMVVANPAGNIIYGSATFDLAATSPDSVTYINDVQKAVKLKIMDDGIHDNYDATGTRRIELIPQPTVISGIDIYHMSSLCQSATQCVMPTGLQPMP